MTVNDWDFNALESLIQERGDNVIHELGINCPCRAEDAYAAGTLVDERPATRRRMGCAQCGGSGRFYRDAKQLKGLITSVESGRNRELLELGYARPGDCTFSPSLHAPQIQDFDRITMLYSTPVSGGEILMRNSANIGDNALLDLGLENAEDRLWYEADCVLWCEDEDGNTYTQGADFTVDGKVITWVANKPDDGKFYTLKYNAYLEWICYVSPLTRFDRNRKLGQRVLLRKIHLADINDHKFDTAAKRQDEALDFTRTKTV